MRFMIIIKATRNSEAGILPEPELFEAMDKFNQELTEAGVMVTGDGLKPSSHGARISLAGGQRTLSRGPFQPTEELVAGFWIWQCASLDEAIEWVKRCPDPMPGEDSVIEIRPIYEMEDFM